MADKPAKKLDLNSGIIEQAGKNLRLFSALWADKRVSGWLKLAFVAGSLFVIIMPDFPTPADDILMIYGLTQVFVGIAPEDVVSDVRAKLAKKVTTQGQTRTQTRDQEEVVEGEFEVRNEDNKQ